MQRNSILEYLERAKDRFPQKIAVDDGLISITWQELYDLSRRIGSTVSGQVPPGKPVPVLMEKSTYMLAAMFGVVFAGCFYVPIHPGQSVGRLKKILNTLENEVLISEPQCRGSLDEAGYTGKILYLNNIWEGAIEEERLRDIRNQSKPTDLLYGIFTSGSTGIPKCVTVSHQAVIRFIGHFIRVFELSEEDRIGNQAPFDFDVSVKDIYTSLFIGGTLTLIPKAFFSAPARLIDYLFEKKITTLIWAVSALCMISALKGFEYRIPSNIRTVMFSGEVMPAGQLAIWQSALPEARFVNLYGPTEITCNCTYYKVDRIYEKNEKLPIGRPFPGRYVFLIDENLRKIREVGKEGEICVAGESLSEGYYREPEQTEKNFFLYSDENDRNLRTYRTGDMGYYGSDGELYFNGRKDFQIKFMGHRIEIEEVEAVIAGISGVERVCCMFDYEKSRLLAFYMGKAEKQEVRSAVKQLLPGHMVPGKLIRVDHMPINKNGKTDRMRLLQMAGGQKE